jgi:hypothetical protein
MSLINRPDFNWRRQHTIQQKKNNAMRSELIAMAKSNVPIKSDYLKKYQKEVEATNPGVFRCILKHTGCTNVNVAAEEKEPQQELDTSRDFWKLISKMPYGDRDELIITQNKINSYYSSKDRRRINYFIIHNKLMNPLISILNNLDITDSDMQKKIAYHAIFKGKSFYEMSILEPEILLYSVPDNLQDTYNLMHS